MPFCSLFRDRRAASADDLAEVQAHIANGNSRARRIRCESYGRSCRLPASALVGMQPQFRPRFRRDFSFSMQRDAFLKLPRANRRRRNIPPGAAADHKDVVVISWHRDGELYGANAHLVMAGRIDEQYRECRIPRASQSRVKWFDEFEAAARRPLEQRWKIRIYQNV